MPKSLREKFFFSRHLFADVNSVQNGNIKHACAIEFDYTNLLAILAIFFCLNCMKIYRRIVSYTMVFTRKTTPEERALIRFLYSENNLSFRNIGIKMKISAATVMRVIKDANIGVSMHSKVDESTV